MSSRTPRLVRFASALVLLAVLPFHTAEASNRITGDGEETGARARAFDVEFGPMFSLPLPVGSAHREVIGLDVGVSASVRTEPLVAIGFDVAYHYWPVTDEMKAGFSDWLRRESWNTIELGPGTWGLQVMEFSGHVRLTPTVAPVLRPWLQIGCGLYRVDPHTSGYRGDAGFFTVIAPPLKATQPIGFSIKAGVDPLGGRFARLGLDAAFHRVMCEKEYRSELRVLTVGAHATFGR